jgi:glutaredoxin 3
MKVKYHADELDQLPDGSQMQEELAKLTGQKTVPNIFIGGVHVGGNDALVHAKEKGKLQKLFESAGVTDAEL